MVAERLAYHHTPATTVDELWYRVEAAWSSVPEHAIQSLFDSMPMRISAVITSCWTTVMRICYRWMHEGTTDRRGRSHPPQCTTSVSARTIRRRLQQSGLSARRSSLGLPLMQNHRRLRQQWWDERRMWVAEWNEVVFTVELRLCLQHHDGRIRVWRHRGERMLNWVMHHHTGPAPGIMVWGGIGSLSHSSSTHCRYFKQPALHLRGDGTSCPSLPSGLGPNHISTG
ncbi:transposable element Tcb1 transposase [Trichonephila clavipes]|nr:transposable element Tcb1 transposase [Trichonephila clavipes]